MLYMTAHKGLLMVTAQQKTVAGIVLIVLSSALLLATGVAPVSLPLVLAGLATAGLAAGSLLIGIAGEGPPV